jgi:hypothetical protein
VSKSSSGWLRTFNVDWSNERYVRIYTRKTVKYLLYPWQTRAIRDLIFKELDRAGILEIGDSDPAEAVSVAIGIPLEVVSEGLPPLLKDGTLAYCDSSIFCPNFLEAQETKQSDKERQRKTREVRRDTKKLEALKLVTERDDAVTNRDETVTSGHTLSHNVTPSHAVLNHAEPINTSESDDIRSVFDYWVKTFSTGKGMKPKLDNKRRGKIRARLKEGFSNPDLFAAILGASKSDFHVSNGYTKLETILRDSGTVENHMARLRETGSSAAAIPDDVRAAKRKLKMWDDKTKAANPEEYAEAVERVKRWEKNKK